jgi:flagellar protein FlaG
MISLKFLQEIPDKIIIREEVCLYMLTEPVHISGQSLAPTAQARLPAGKEIPQRDNKVKEEAKEQDLSHLAGLVVDVQNNLNLIHDVDLQFSVHEASGEIMVTVSDKSTGEVIREVPPSEVLNLAARLEQMIGLIFDQKG